MLESEAFRLSTVTDTTRVLKHFVFSNTSCSQSLRVLKHFKNIPDGSIASEAATLLDGSHFALPNVCKLSALRTLFLVPHPTPLLYASLSPLPS
jgi:hypothetical protein